MDTDFSSEGVPLEHSATDENRYATVEMTITLEISPSNHPSFRAEHSVVEKSFKDVIKLWTQISSSQTDLKQICLQHGLQNIRLYIEIIEVV